MLVKGPDAENSGENDDAQPHHLLRAVQPYELA